jgi:predicted nucleic acid-binding protein
MILVDTSIWIAIIRGEIAVDEKEYEDFYTCGPVLQEVFQGLEEGALLFAISNIPCLSDPLPAELFRHAAGIYRQGRRRGLTIRSAMDCLIAAIALDNGATIWHRDRDFDNIAQFTDLRVRRSLWTN